MKKRLLIILMALVLCLTLGFAVACDPDEPGPNPGPGPDTPSGDIPTQEGKITLYFTIKNVGTMNPKCSYYICGSFFGEGTGWKEGNLEGKLTNIEGTDTYYCFADPSRATPGAGFKIVIGYNETSGVDVSQQGPFWSNEGFGPWPAASADNTIPEYEAGATSVFCPLNYDPAEYSDVIEFDGSLGDPVPVTNFRLRVSFVKGQLDPDKAVVYILGGFTSWANTPADERIIASYNEDVSEEVDVWELTIAEMFAKPDVDYLVVVFPHGLEGLTPLDDDGNVADAATATVWYYFNAEGSDAIKVADGTANMKTAVTSSDNNQYIDLAGTISEAYVGTPAKGLDTTLVGEDGVLDMNADQPTVEVSLKVKFASAVAADLHVYLIGDLNSWNAVEMTANADRTEFTAKLTMYQRDAAALLSGAKNERPDGACQYKVVLATGAFSWEDTTRIDIGCAGDTDGGSEVLVKQGAKNYGQKGFTVEGPNELFDGAVIELPA